MAETPCYKPIGQYTVLSIGRYRGPMGHSPLRYHLSDIIFSRVANDFEIGHVENFRFVARKKLMRQFYRPIKKQAVHPTLGAHHG